VKTALLTAAFLLPFGAAVMAQDEDEDQLTPAQAMEMLRDVKGFMDRAEELLNDGSRGRALETEQDLRKKLEQMFRDEPEVLQRQILEKIKKLTERAEKRQKDAIEKMAELLKRARTQQGRERQPRDGQPRSETPKDAGSPAPKPYPPNRTDPPSVFRSKLDRAKGWGDLPPRIREAFMQGKRDIDEYPAEFQGILRRLTQELANPKD